MLIARALLRIARNDENTIEIVSDCSTYESSNLESLVGIGHGLYSVPSCVSADAQMVARNLDQQPEPTSREQSKEDMKRYRDRVYKTVVDEYFRDESFESSSGNTESVAGILSIHQLCNFQDGYEIYSCDADRKNNLRNASDMQDRAGQILQSSSSVCGDRARLGRQRKNYSQHICESKRWIGSIYKFCRVSAVSISLTYAQDHSS